MDLYEEALTRHGIGFDTEHNFLSIASYSYQEGRSAWKKLKKINPDADVIICLSDIILPPLNWGLGYRVSPDYAPRHETLQKLIVACEPAEKREPVL